MRWPTSRPKSSMVDEQPTSFDDIEGALTSVAGTSSIEVKNNVTGVTLHWDSISRFVEVEGDADGNTTIATTAGVSPLCFTLRPSFNAQAKKGK